MKDNDSHSLGNVYKRARSPETLLDGLLLSVIVPKVDFQELYCLSAMVSSIETEEKRSGTESGQVKCEINIDLVEN